MPTIYKQTNEGEEGEGISNAFTSNVPKVILPHKDPKLEAEKLYHETLRRRKEACNRESVEFNLNKHQDANDILFAQHRITQKNEYGQDYGTETLARIQRVILENPSSFDIDENGNTLTNLSETRESIIYSLDCQLEDGRYSSKGHRNSPRLMGFISNRGSYEKPVVRWTYGKDGVTPIRGEQIGHTTQYFIPYTPENVQELLQKYPKHKTFNASVRYESDTVGSYTCKDLSTFTNEQDGRAIIEANKEGFMKLGGPNAISNYRKFIEQKIHAEKLGRKVISIDLETESLIKETGMDIEQIVKEQVKQGVSSRKKKK